MVEGLIVFGLGVVTGWVVFARPQWAENIKQRIAGWLSRS